jgi:hypothetical protein
MRAKYHAAKNISILLLSVCVFVLTAFTTAHADSIGYTTSAPISSTLTDWSGTLSFQQFNPSFGTLTGVELILNSSLNTTLTVTNSGLSTSNGKVTTTSIITVADSGALFSQYIVATWPLSNPLVPTTGLVYTLSAGGSSTSGPFSTTGTSDSSYTLASLLAEFTGSSSISLAASTYTQTNLSNNGGNTTASQVTHAGLTGEVIYTYTAVPLPSALPFYWVPVSLVS